MIFFNSVKNTFFSIIFGLKFYTIHFFQRTLFSLIFLISLYNSHSYGKVGRYISLYLYYILLLAGFSSILQSIKILWIFESEGVNVGLNLFFWLDFFEISFLAFYSCSVLTFGSLFLLYCSMSLEIVSTPMISSSIRLFLSVYSSNTLSSERQSSKFS